MIAVVPEAIGPAKRAPDREPFGGIGNPRQPIIKACSWQEGTCLPRLSRRSAPRCLQAMQPGTSR